MGRRQPGQGQGLARLTVRGRRVVSTIARCARCSTTHACPGPSAGPGHARLTPRPDGVMLDLSFSLRIRCVIRNISFPISSTSSTNGESAWPPSPPLPRSSSSAPASSATASSTTSRARLDRHRADRPGAAAQPRRVDRARLELHLPGGPLAGDHRPDARLRQAVQGDGRLHAVRRLRGRPDRGADGGAASPHVQRQGVGHRGRDRRPRVRRREGAVPRPRPDHRSLLDAVGRRRRLAARRHDHARERTGQGCADRGAERRGHRPRRRGHRARPTDPPRAHRPGRHRGGVRRDRLRCVEPEDRRHGRRTDRR